MLNRLSFVPIKIFWPLLVLTAIVIAGVGIKTQRNWRSLEPLVLPRMDSILVALFLVPYLAFMLWNVAFVYHDNDGFVALATGGRQPLDIWPYVGRYFPLEMQEFNILSNFSTTALFYQSVVAVQLVIFCGLILIALSSIPAPWRVGAVILLLCSNSIGIIFADPVYPERNIVFAMAIVIVAVQRFDRSASRLNFIAAASAAHLSLYYKEPMFLLIGTFAVLRLALTWWQARPSGWKWLRAHPLELTLIGICLVFFSQLFLTSLAVRSSAYVSSATVGMHEALWRYFRTDMFLLPLIAALVLRFRHLRIPNDLDRVWDPLVLAAIVYFAALIAIGLHADRYSPPVDLIAVLFLAREASYWWHSEKGNRWIIAGVTALTFVAVSALGVFRLYEHKSVIVGSTEMAKFLDSYAKEQPGEIRVYFPNAEGWRIMNFAAYLKYQYPDTSERIRLLSPAKFPNNRCAPWQDFRCEHADRAERGDIVAQLPDDTARDSAKNRRMLFTYNSILGHLPVALSAFWYPEVPLYDGASSPPVGWLAASLSLQE